MTPRSHTAHTADRAVESTHTATTDSGESPVVHWPEPSPLESWWKTIMRPRRT